MPNRLARATSPYLQQHADNPVDWYEWGPAALERARSEDRPIHLSIGYAACHWCHVMAHESFEDPETAALLNELFVNIKVDREERPDLDSIYMQAVQAMTGRGGWPMTMFLLPDGTPFYGGTYFPPEDRHGLPAFRRVAASVARAYRERGDDVRRSADQLRAIYAPPATGQAGGGVPARVLDDAVGVLAGAFDPVHAGFGGAPKFPPSMALSFLVTQWARTGDLRALAMAHETFVAMARGGICDQLGGGIHRYSVDDRWLVPHFEKMLYDNALLIRAGVELWQATGDPEVRDTVSGALDWVEREMVAPEGGFRSSLDADSEGEEGRYYVWSLDEVRAAGGADAAAAIARWGVTEAGNFEGRNVLHVALGWEATAQRVRSTVADVQTAVERAGRALFAVRERRVAPGRDDKVVAAWNGLMLRAVALAARVLDEPRWVRMARTNAEFLLGTMVRDGRLRRAWRAGALRPEGFLDDQAAVGLGLLEVYALTGERRWLDAGVERVDAILAHFRDPETGVLYDTPHDHEALISRPADPTDNAVPSGTSLAAELLLRVAILTGRAAPRDVAVAVLERLTEPAARYPAAFGHALVAMDLAARGSIEVVINTGGEPDAAQGLLRAVAAECVPGLVLVRGDDAALSELPVGAGKGARGGRPTAYVCRRYECDAPTTEPEVVAAQLRALRGGRPDRR